MATDPAPLSSSDSSTTNTGDWDHVKETVRMLNLAVARLEHAMLDITGDVETLTQSFTAFGNSIDDMRYAADEMPDAMPHKHAILYHANAVSTKISSAVMAFQFYDKLTQRLTHISKSLQGLNEIIEDNEQRQNPQSWNNLQEMIQSKYILDSDKAMFDAILQGKSVQEVLTAAVNNASEDDVELF